MGRLIGILTSVIMLLPGLAFGQFNCDLCTEALIPDVVSWHRSVESELHTLNVINENNFSKFKREYGFGGAFVIQGIPVSVDTTYSNFNERRSNLFSLKEFNFSHKESVDYYKKTLSSVSASSFIQCLRLCAQNHGLSVNYNSSDNYERIEVNLKYLPAPGVGSVKVQAIEALNAERIQNYNSVFMPGHTMEPLVTETLLFSRNKFEESRLLFRVGNYVHRVYIPPAPKEVFREITIRLKEDQNYLLGLPYIPYRACFKGDKDHSAGTIIMIEGLSWEPVFGTWENPQCGTAGNGWHFAYGTCKTGKGQGLKGLLWVEYKVLEKVPVE